MLSLGCTVRPISKRSCSSPSEEDTEEVIVSSEPARDFVRPDDFSDFSEDKFSDFSDFSEEKLGFSVFLPNLVASDLVASANFFASDFFASDFFASDFFASLAESSTLPSPLLTAAVLLSAASRLARDMPAASSSSGVATGESGSAAESAALVFLLPLFNALAAIWLPPPALFGVRARLAAALEALRPRCPPVLVVTAASSVAISESFAASVELVLEVASLRAPPTVAFVV